MVSGSIIPRITNLTLRYTHRIGDIPLRRIGTPTDAGRAILAMVSPLFSYITGQVSQAIDSNFKQSNK